MLAEDYQDASIQSPHLANTKESILNVLNQITADHQELPIEQHLRWKIDHLKSRVENEQHLEVGHLIILLKELHNDITFELSKPYFLMIPAQRRGLYEQREPLFGRAVEDKFPDASNDIAAAGRCLALDEWTAAVFHLMGVVEHGLRDLAARLNLSMAAGMEFENWQTIIDKMEKEIRRLETLPKGPGKAEALRFYSQAASSFAYFKNAWRNHVSHSRAVYDEREALRVWNHVRDFMDDLVKGSS